MFKHKLHYFSFKNFFLFFLFLLLFSGTSLAHSVQVGYCWNCNGDLRIWVEHWHGTEDPTTTTMTLDIKIGGVTTSRTGIPDTWVYNTTKENLPGCANPVTIFGACSNSADQYNDWIAYDFTGLPTNVPIEVIIIKGHNVFTEDCGGMYPASTGTIIIPDPPTYDDIVTCSGPGVTIPEIPAGNDNVWTNDNPSIGLPASGTGSIPEFTPTTSTTQQVANIHMSSTCGETDFQIIIKPSPSVAFSGDGVNTGICFDDQPVNLNSNTSAPPGESVDSWQWDYGDGNSGTGTNTSHTYGSPGVYTVNLLVEASNGCQNEIAHDVRVSPMPAAQFETFSVCFDDDLTVTDQSTVDNTEGDNITSWNWDFDNGQTATGKVPTPTPVFSHEGVYDISLTVETNYGCKNTYNYEVTLYPLPDVDFSATTECLHFTTVFTNESSISNLYSSNTNDVYSWDFGDGTTSSLENPVHAYGAAGDYTVNLEITSNHGCKSDVTHTITVWELPVADFTFLNACDNEAIAFSSTATSIDASNQFNKYLWDVNQDNSVDYNGASISHVFNHDGFYDVTHVVEDINGCRDTVTHEITVYALPTADFTFTNVCEDATTTFTNNSSIVPVDGDNITNYFWDFDNGSSSTVENPTLDFGTERVYQVKLVAKTNYGCLDSIIKNVEVYPLPHVDFLPTEVCLEYATQFTDESLISNQYTTNANVMWDWDFGDGGTSNLQNPTHAYTSDGTFDATLIVTTNNNCVSDTTITVVVHPLPEVSFNGFNLEGCSPLCPSAESTSSINSPSSLDFFEWSLSDGSVYYGPNFIDCYENLSGQDMTFDLTLTVTSNKGCVSSFTEEDYIHIYHNPIADFDYTPSHPDVINTKVRFLNNSSYADSYIWHIGNYSPFEEVSPVIDFPNTPAVYPITLFAFTDKGCSDTIYGTIEIKDRLVFYIPNTFTPDNDDYNETFQPIFTNGYEPDSYTLFIYNRWGELVFESHNTNMGWDGTYGVDRDKLVRDGTYVWKITFKETMSDKSHIYTGHVNLIR